MRLATRPAPPTNGTRTRCPKLCESSCSRRLADATLCEPLTWFSSSVTARLRSRAGRIQREPDEQHREEDAADRENEPDLRHRYPRSSASSRTPADQEQAGSAEHHEPDLGREQQHDVLAVDREHVERDRRTASGRGPRPRAGPRTSAPGPADACVARSRSVSATLSRISARFPPTSRWMFTARTAHLKSALPTRSASASSASSALRPRRISATTRWNSVAAGCAISFADRVERLQEAVPGAQRARHDRQDVGELLAELLGAASRARLRSISVGTRPHDGSDAEREPRACAGSRRRGSARRTPPRRVTTTNSPDRRLTPAASSSASSRPLKPRASREPTSELGDTLRGSSRRAGLARRRPATTLATPVADGRHALSDDGPSCACAAAVPKSMTPSRNAAARPTSRWRGRAAARAAPEVDGGEHQSRLPSTRARRPRGRRTRRAPPACRGTSGRRPVDFRRPRNLPSSSMPGREVEQEDVLEGDDVALHARDLGHVREAARAVLQALLVHDQLDRRGDLLADRARRQLHARPSS